MIELEYKKQLAYLPRSFAVNLLRYAEAHSLPSLDLEHLPLHHQYSEELRFHCGQLSNLIWECWENIKHRYTLPDGVQIEPRRRTPFITLEGHVLRAKYYNAHVKDVMALCPNLGGHLSDILELRLAFPEHVWNEMREVHLAEESSFSSFLLRVLDMYDFKIAKGKTKQDTSDVVPEVENDAGRAFDEEE